MTQDEAKREALSRWRLLPKAKRSSDQQAAEFAMKLQHEGGLRFRCSGDPYQRIKGWLLNDLNWP